MDFESWARPACIAELGGFRPPEDPLASRLGRVGVARPDEGWPTTDGAPMLAVAQINLVELPCRGPDALSDVALITLFVGPWQLPVDEPNGVNWELRAYPSLEGLTPLPEPISARAGDPKARKGENGTLRPFPIAWQEWLDMPCRDCVPVELADDWDEWSEARDLTRLTSDRTKVGGWPSCLQGDVRWSLDEHLVEDAEFVMQIATEEKAGLAWGDDGIAYIARRPGGGRDDWYLAWQSY
jgi:Domain of unknown function (DUF1963)